VTNAPSRLSAYSSPSTPTKTLVFGVELQKMSVAQFADKLLLVIAPALLAKELQ
jgi:hypothetical protein